MFPLGVQNERMSCARPPLPSPGLALWRVPAASPHNEDLCSWAPPTRCGSLVPWGLRVLVILEMQTKRLLSHMLSHSLPGGAVPFTGRGGAALTGGGFTSLGLVSPSAEWEF